MDVRWLAILVLGMFATFTCSQLLLWTTRAQQGSAIADRTLSQLFRQSSQIQTAQASKARDSERERSGEPEFGMGTHPRDVFLWYTRTEKTSSSIVATLISRAYELEGLSVVQNPGDLRAAAAGAYASVDHIPYSDEKFKRLRLDVQRPVLLVVSTREGSDWIASQTFRADRLKSMNITSCDQLLHHEATCKRYSKYLPGPESYAVPWWVIRHEHVVEDTCAMLRVLKLPCPKDYALGQHSRSELEDNGLRDCPKPDKSKDVQCINNLNSYLNKSQPKRSNRGSRQVVAGICDHAGPEVCGKEKEQMVKNTTTAV